MKTLILILISSVVLISCGSNKFKKKLTGNWYEINENLKLQLDKDSIKISDIGFKKTTWSANKNQIKYNYKTFFNDTVIKVSLKYKLLSNDSLLIDPYIDTLPEALLLKANNFIDFLFKKNKVNITLDDNPNAEYQKTDGRYGIKIFIGYQNDSIITKTEYSDNLENLQNDFDKILTDINPYFKNEYNEFMRDRITYKQWIKMNIYYSLFVDKNIPENVITSVVDKLRKSKIKKVYRVFKTKEENGIPFDNLKEVKL